MGRYGVPGEPLGLSVLGNGAGMLGRGWEQWDIGVYGAHGAEGTWPTCGQSSSQDAGPQASTHDGRSPQRPRGTSQRKWGEWGRLPTYYRAAYKQNK